MKNSDVVIVGGSAAGLTAAITARRHYPEKKILLVRKEDKVPIPCGIPYVFGTVGSPDKNLIPDSILEQNKVELLVDEVVELDRQKRMLQTISGDKIQYDKLILATGSLPMTPPIPGIDKENVFSVVKDNAHLARIQGKLKSAKKVAIIGGGFIGVEFADEFNKLGHLDVTIIELLPHCLQLAFDPEICEEVENLLIERRIKIITNQKVVSIEGNKKVKAVNLISGAAIDADVVIIGIGALANVELAKKAGLRFGPTNSIWVDGTMRTMDENIFACGDCAEKTSFFGGKPSKLKLASIAGSEARIAGANLFGVRRENLGTIGVFSTCIGDRAFAMAGLTETAAREMGYDGNIVVGTAKAPNRHPGGMPGMVPQTVKLIFENRTRVLVGAEIMGDKAVGELINAASACIQHRMTVDDIACFQMGTHPALTASPIVYQFVNAAESALVAMRERAVVTVAA
jgi:NADH oxidase (H2O2-forming)